MLSPDEMARRLQYRHKRGWLIWYGRSTGEYWALASWVSGPDGMLCAATPQALDTAITALETLHPKPAQ